MIPHAQLAVEQQTRDLLGERGISEAAQRLSTHQADCVSCQQPLAELPTALSATHYPVHDLVAVSAHHATCPQPSDGQISVTYMMSGCGMPAGPMMFVHPSLERVWLRPQRGQHDGDIRGWSDTTATAFTDLGFEAGYSDTLGWYLPTAEQPVPNSGVQLARGVVQVDVPPYDSWSVTVPDEVAAMIRSMGGSYVLISTATDYRGDLETQIMQVLRSDDYVVGWVPLATQQRQLLDIPARITHPMLRSSAVPTVCRATYVDDPALARGFAIITGDGVATTGVDTDRWPVVQFEHLHGQIDTDTGRWPLLDGLVQAGMPRLDWAGQIAAPVLDQWHIQHSSDGTMQLRGPHGAVYATGTPEPTPDWISAAVGHRRAFVLVGPMLGIRDCDTAEQSRAELDTAGARGLVLGGIVEYHRGAAAD